MLAGRELDALIAERMMGEKEKTICPECNSVWKFCNCPCLNPIFAPYSTEISEAWKLVELPIFDGWVIGKNCNGKWQVWNLYEHVEVSKGDTAPHAICLAALKGIELQDGFRIRQNPSLKE